MVVIERYRHSDKQAVHALFRRVHGEPKSRAYLDRWSWQYELNPALRGEPPLIWLLRRDGEVIGQYATMPVRLSVYGTEIDAAWGTDVMIAPEHRRQGFGRPLFEAWDRNTGAAIGLGLTDASHELFKKLQWPGMARVPRLVRPLSRRTGGASTRLGKLIVPLRAWRARLAPTPRHVHVVDRFAADVTSLWERSSSHFAFAVRRDATYLNWKFVEVPHLRYKIATIGTSETRGYVVIRHVEEPGQRVTLLVDFLADPDDPRAFGALLDWVEREAVRAGADLIRVFGTHQAFHPGLSEAGYVEGAAGIRLVTKINAIQPPPQYYETVGDWHVTLGDSDADR